MDVLQLVVTVAATVGTAIQLRLSLIDFGATRKDAVDWWNAEDELIAEAPRLRRRRVRRELKAWRDAETHRTIRDLKLAVGSWALLLVASVLATYAALIEALG